MNCWNFINECKFQWNIGFERYQEVLSCIRCVCCFFPLQYTWIILNMLVTRISPSTFLFIVQDLHWINAFILTWKFMTDILVKKELVPYNKFNVLNCFKCVNIANIRLKLNKKTYLYILYLFITQKTLNQIVYTFVFLYLYI